MGIGKLVSSNIVLPIRINVNTPGPDAVKECVERSGMNPYDFIHHCGETMQDYFQRLGGVYYIDFANSEEGLGDEGKNKGRGGIVLIKPEAGSQRRQKLNNARVSREFNLQLVMPFSSDYFKSHLDVGYGLVTFQGRDEDARGYIQDMERKTFWHKDNLYFLGGLFADPYSERLISIEIEFSKTFWSSLLERVQREKEGAQTPAEEPERNQPGN